MSVHLEQGQIVSVRRKVWAITAVSKSKTNGDDAIHKISLECLADEGLGTAIDVIWEREVAPKVLEAKSLPQVTGIDSREAFTAFLDSIRWGCASVVRGDILQAPFRGGIEIEEYQLAPVIRALQMPRVALLIADDVGLGKTIEAGLVAQELIHSHRATKILVICPAHLQTKWCDEMQEKFGLEFRIVDRDAIEDMRREYGPTINPWASFPRLITSMDYLKREQPRRLFEELLHNHQTSKAIKPWDLLILDEAHNVAPAGRGAYIRDSDRTSLLRAISPFFEHRLFLTATPHNGYRESFTGLLELLDNYRFSRGTELQSDHLNAVTIRRLKQDIKRIDGTPRFSPRVVLPKDEKNHPELYVDLTDTEQGLYETLAKYSQTRQLKSTKRSDRATKFVLTLLKKRALSCPLALRESLIVHSQSAGVKDELGIGDSLFNRLEDREQDDWSDDDDREELLSVATEQASRLFAELDTEEKKQLDGMFRVADTLSKQPDSKCAALIKWINAKLKSKNQWNGERVIVFTEYRHTLEYLRSMLEAAGMADAIDSIYGGMPDNKRDEVARLFQSPPEDSPIRILLATDAASEGADFQKYCRNIIHYDIPWNPVRLEQRNGRIDRHGQHADEVRIHHFVFRNNEDSEFLKRIVEKVEAIRTDLGSVGAIIADNIRQHALGKQVDLNQIDNDTRRKLARQDFNIQNDSDHDAATMVKALNEARLYMGISDESQLNVLRQALLLELGIDPIVATDEKTFSLTKIPPTWRDCMKYVINGGYQPSLTFDRSMSRTDKDVNVLHLDHPLMARAMAALRSQMWKGPESHIASSLHRVTAVAIPGLEESVLVAWARLIVLGPANNRLHEGLIGCAIGATSGENIPIERIEALTTNEALQPSASVKRIEELVNTHINDLHTALSKAANTHVENIKSSLSARGAAVHSQTRALITERMADIRKSIRHCQKLADTGVRQLSLFEDEQDQLSTDIHLLQQRLAELDAERETEPSRLRKLYEISESRLYPLAIQAILLETENV